MPAITINERVQKHRANLRASGLRPVQIWVPDTRRTDFDEECRRQSLVVAEVERKEAELDRLMDSALSNVEGWTE